MTATVSLMPFAAAWDFSPVQELLGIVLRLALAVGAAVVTYYVSGPLVRLLYRLAFHRPMPNGVTGLARLGGGVLVGVLVFFLLPLGFGGGGSGWGLGGGGSGVGKDSGNGKDAKDNLKDGKDPSKKGDNDSDKGQVLPIEMVLSRYYHKEYGPNYLIHEPSLPKKLTVAEYKERLSTLDQVKSYLIAHKDRVRKINILVYQDSVADSDFAGIRVTHKAVKQLEKLAAELKLPVGHEEAVLNKKKPDLVE